MTDHRDPLIGYLRDHVERGIGSDTCRLSQVFALIEQYRTRYEPDAAELDRLRRIVKRAAGMGLCSQTHHEHLMLDARAALAPEGSARDGG